MPAAVPLSELAGTVRNQEEARAIAQVDVLLQQEEIILQHLVATHGYLLGVSQCEQAITDVGPTPRLNAAAVLVGQQRAALAQNIAMLEERLAGVVAQLKASQVSLQRYAEVNRSVHAELVEAGCLELAVAKQKLWRVETEMCDGISRRLKERAASDAGMHGCPPATPDQTSHYSLAPDCPTIAFGHAGSTPRRMMSAARPVAVEHLASDGAEQRAAAAGTTPIAGQGQQQVKDSR
jgi:hypothetical protein